MKNSTCGLGLGDINVSNLFPDRSDSTDGSAWMLRAL